MNNKTSFLELVITLVLTALAGALAMWLKPSDECKEKYKEEIKQCVLSGGDDCVAKVCDIMKDEED